MMRCILALLAFSFLADAAVTIKRVRASGGDYSANLAGLQSAVDDCRSLNTDLCVVDVQAGLTYSHSTVCQLTLNAQSAGTKFIVIRSSRISELPEGTRVTEADAAAGKLVKIENACSGDGGDVRSHGVIVIPPETTGVVGTPAPSHYILQGIETHFSGEGKNCCGAVNIGYHPSNIKARAFWQSPHTIVVDRCWMHGNPSEQWVTASSTHSNQNGITANGINITIKDSLTTYNNIDAADHSNAEGHGFSATNAPGPFYVLNSKFGGGSIPSLVGGDWTWIPGLVPSGGYFYGNEYTSDPHSVHWLEWDTTDTLDTTMPCISGTFWEQKVSPFNKWKCVAGAWQSSSDVRANRTWIKNGFEFKSMRLAFVEGNYIHHTPATGDQSQYGFCWLVNSVDGQESAFFARTEHVKFRFNHCYRNGQGPTLGGLPFATPQFRLNNSITIQHNLVSDMGGVRVSPKQGAEFTTGGGNGFLASWVERNLRFDHNTTTYDRSNGGTGMRIADSTPSLSDVYIKDNIGFWGVLGQTPIDVTNEACSAFRGILYGAAYWDNIGIVDTNGRGQTAFNNLYGGTGCPSSISRAADLAAVRFADPSNGDFRLCTGSGTPHASCPGASPWITSGSDGGPLGADGQQVIDMTTPAKTGTYDQKLYFGVNPVSFDGSTFTYTPYDPRGGECNVRVTNAAGSVTHNESDGISGNTISSLRTMTVVTGSPGEYTFRVRCKDRSGTWKRWKESVFKKY